MDQSVLNQYLIGVAGFVVAGLGLWWNHRRNKNNEKQPVVSLPTNSQIETQEVVEGTSTVAEQLSSLQALFDEGLITQNEFEAKKQDILDRL